MIWRSIAGLFGRAAATVRGHSFGSAVPQTVSVEEARLDPTVAAALRLVTDTVSKLPLQAKGNAQINRVLQHPNALQNGGTFHADVVTDLVLYGNALCEIGRGASGSLLGLYPLSPEPAPAIEANGGTVSYTFPDGQVYRNRRIGGDRAYEIVHVRDSGGHVPWSPSRINGVGIAIRASIEANRYIAHTFRNGLRIHYFFRREKGGRLGDDGQTKFDEMMNTVTGDANAKEPNARTRSYLYIDDLEVTPVKGLTPADGDFRGFRADLKLEIAAGIGVPPFRAGADANTKYSNASAANAALVRDHILAIVANVTATFSEALGVPITCDTNRLIKGDLMDQIKAAVAARGGPIAALDEAREIADFPSAETKQRAEILAMGKGAPPPRDREGERRDLPEDEQ